VDDIRSVLRFTAEFSVANAAAALSALEPIVAAAQP
jgi:hypothetical protein